MEFTPYLESARVSGFFPQRDQNTRRNILDTYVLYVQNFEIDEYYACIFTKQTITPVNYINTENTI